MARNYKQAVTAGKNDSYSEMVGGFVVAQMPDGSHDYFPNGQPPHIVNSGNIVKCGEIVARFHYNQNGRTWKKL
jgi:hypothetical protein